MFGRIFSNTIKHIKRSGWIGVGSVAVVTLSFFIMIVFGGLAYISNLYIKSFENRSNILVFFEVGMQDTPIIEELKTKWQNIPQVDSIGFTSEEQAYDKYLDYSSVLLTSTYTVLKQQEIKKLNSSLDIRLKTLDEFEKVVETIQADIDFKLQELIIVDLEKSDAKDNTEASDEATAETQPTEATSSEGVLPETQDIRYQFSEEPNQPPIQIGIDSESLETQRSAFSRLRLGGVVVITMLSIVIFFLTFMTVEFRLYNQMEEIGVMQLVGGSLFFIRAPYVLESGFYGLVGALTATGILGSIYLLIFEFKIDPEFRLFLLENFSVLEWPEVQLYHVLGIISAIGLIGFLLGAISSYLSIRRYIR